MSSRALRRAQRELEEKEQQEKLAAQKKQEEDSDDGETESLVNARTSLFAALGDAEEDDGEDGEDEDTDTATDARDSSTHPSSRKETAPVTSNAKRKKKRKGKEGKRAPGQPDQTTSVSKKPSQELDEIDIALRALSTTAQDTEAETQRTNPTNAELLELFQLLSVDSQHLHAANEMRRLFGRAALEDHEEGDQAAGGRRRGRGQGQVGIAGAVAGRNMPGGRGLATLGLRRNMFIQGKEDWPKAPAGGLGMEIVKKNPDGTVEYRFVHSSSYQDVQSQFETCVASMDPNRMVQLLQYNPYHISTLLQVSEIAKQERDHATSGDLLERALFSFGRAVHSTFSTNVSQGKARLDFRRPENREFWLASWRYIANLSMRATWRTVYEWAKLLLALSPSEDPYKVGLVIDQFAVRGRQQAHFISLATSSHFQDLWKDTANIPLTLGLAYIQTSNPSTGRKVLREAIERCPWVAARLFSELQLEPIPPSVWGASPPTPYDDLETALYATRAKDTWNTPEATALLMEVASAAKPSSATSTSIPSEKTIDLDLARHTILTDTPALIALVPREFTSQMRSISDPLPPPDNLPSYTPRAPRTSGRHPTISHHDLDALMQEHEELLSFFRPLRPARRTGTPADPASDTEADNDDRRGPPTREDIERLAHESGISAEEMMARMRRVLELQTALGEAFTVLGIPPAGMVRRAAMGGEAGEESDEGLVRDL
ncbi:hypothetical protein W97_01920 [Coniosporium apollinis CBS 100218]|uniref:DUF654-domain-containing protein n=1 Tax=Coniosporium apollinis (strain CBS 100218) TaxID=1168221 RepID=R7YM42_CONA1|nr:uncharacterized protein W97_01920 [Coniosporium apollinis CBS 100218]EON62696.1 hypothetical protein W97_01920 [Coniosporium apollinis CBS 100218]